MTELDAVNGFCAAFKHNFAKTRSKSDFYFYDNTKGIYVKSENAEAAKTEVQHKYEVWLTNKANFWFNAFEELKKKSETQEISEKESKHLKELESKAKAHQKLLTIDSMNKCVRRIINHETFLSDLDKEPNHIINMRGVVWDMKENKQVERGVYKMTRSTGIKPEKMPTPVWDKFLDDLFPNFEDKYYMLKLLGYIITGENEKQLAYVMTGVGGDGKSVFNRVIMAMLGEYATTLDEWVFDADKDKEKRETVFETLQGIRYAGISEIRKNMPLHESEFKKMTGSDPVIARALHKKAFMMTIQTKLCFYTNHMFSWNDNTNAIKRRLRVYAIPVNKEIVRDPALFSKLEGELGGILHKSLEMAHDYYKFRHTDYLSETDQTKYMKKCLDEHLQFNDPLLEFFNECCDFQEKNRVKRKDLYEAYQRFSRDSGEYNHMKKREFNKEITSRGIFRSVKVDGYEMWVDVSLKEEYVIKEFQQNNARVRM